MVKPETDWKNQSFQVLDWLAVALAGVLVVVSVGLWWVIDSRSSIVVAVVFAAWIGVYFSRHWQPVLYPVSAVVAVLVAADFVYSDVVGRPLVLGTIALTIGFAVVSMVLFVREEQPYD